MGRKNYRKSINEDNANSEAASDMREEKTSQETRAVDVNTILLVIILVLLVVQTYLMLTADDSPKTAEQEYSPTEAPQGGEPVASPKQGQQITLDPNSGQPAGGSNAVAVYSENEVNLGTISKGKKVKHTFSLKNTGTEDLVYGDVSTDPGLLVLDGPAPTIPPGGSGSITVELNTADLAGPVTKIVHVNSNSEPTHHHLEVKATVQ